MQFLYFKLYILKYFFLYPQLYSPKQNFCILT